MGNINTLEVVLNFTTQLTNEKYELEQQLAASQAAYELVTKDCRNLTERVIPNIKAESQAREKVLRESINLLYSWANNWDSEFMNDPDWVNRDVEIVQRAAFLPSDDSAPSCCLGCLQSRPC
jgi:hypothetical protein